MSTSKGTHVWQAVDADYIGSTGTNSIEEFAHAILTSDDPGIHEVIGLDEDVMAEDTMLSRVINFLESHGAKAVAVPTRILGEERWNGRYREIEMDARPGRGYVKVIGVSF